MHRMVSELGASPRFFRRVLAAIFAITVSFSAAQNARALTFVIDFKDAGSPVTQDIFNADVVAFDITAFGFVPSAFNSVTAAIMSALDQDFHGIANTTMNGLSPIPVGQELDIDFVIGDIGGGASNGDSDFYYIQVGDRAPGETITSLGQACLACVRGSAPIISVGSVVGSIFTDNLASLLGGAVGGDLGLMANVIDGTLAHEIGHALSLEHCYPGTTDNGNAPLMGTGASPYSMPNSERLTDREFAFSCNTQPGTQNSVQQLVDAVGLRDAPVEASLPEPAMGVLFGLGLAGIGAARRFGRRAA